MEAASSPYSSMFKASVAEGKVEVVIMADQEAESNIMSERVFKNTREELLNLKRVSLSPAKF